jgi:hypothetical protein
MNSRDLFNSDATKTMSLRKSEGETDNEYKDQCSV